MKISINWFKKDELLPQMTGIFLVPAIYISRSQSIIGTIFWVSVIWIRFVRTAHILFEDSK